MLVRVDLKDLFRAVLVSGLLVSVAAQAQDKEVSDPLESMNRGIFWFNDTLDVNIAEPVARAYDSVVPNAVQDSVNNVFDTLSYPSYLVSDLVQFKFTQAASHTGRFAVNATLGLLGIVDVAKHMGLEKHKEDFGLALAYHEVPAGPYLVLPFLGPSNLRDGVGRIVDTLLNPLTLFFYFHDTPWQTEWSVTIGVRTVEFVQTRADLIEAVEAAKDSSLDYYSFVQSSYYQYRRGLLYDGNPPEEDADISFDDEDEIDPDEIKPSTGEVDLQKPPGTTTVAP